MRPSSLLVAVLFLALLSAPSLSQSSQTLPVGFDTMSGASGGTAYPQNAAGDQKWQWHYANSNFSQPGPITITEIYVRAENGSLSVAAFDFPNFTVTCSEATTQYSVLTHDPVFANNLGANTQVVRTGPWVGGPVPPSGGSAATWIPLGVTQSFVFDPTLGKDFLIQIEKCGTNALWNTYMDGKSGVSLANGGNRYGELTDCNAAAHAFQNDEFVPIVRIDYLLGGSTNYCTAGTTTHGCVPSIGGTGTPSASASSGFTIAVGGVEGQKQGLLFYGVDNSGFTPLAWGASTSFMCVKSPVQRTAVQNSGGTVNLCDGTLALDWNAFRAANPGALGQPFAAGQQVYAQGWFRDPPTPKSTLLSDGLRFVVQP